MHLPLGELTALSQTLYNFSLLLPYQGPLPRFGLEFHDFPVDKFLSKPMGSVNNQNCCKGFRFKEKVEKHCLR